MSSSAAQSASPTPATTAPVVSATSTPVAPSATSATPTSSSTTSTTPSTTPSSSASSSAISSSSSSTSSSVSSTESSSVASSTTSTSTSSSAPRASSSSSLSFVVQTSNGQVFTQTAVVTVPAFTPTQSQSAQSSTSFFHNTGAVAGVFSAVGVIALIAIFFLLTSFIRRRRARKFDREIDEAAAAAAASAQAPDFDDYDFTSGTGYGHYSETSHGTFSQPPLSHEQSHNNLADIPTYEPYTGAGGAGAGAAGIGARGRSVRSGGQPDPYGALANPPEQYEMYETRRSWHQGNPQGGPAIPTYDILQAAGLAGSDPYAVTRRASTGLPMLPGQSQPGNNGLNRSQSQGASAILPTTAETYPTSTPAPVYPGGQDTPYPPEKARYSASYAPGGGVSTMPPDIDEDPYGGYNEQPPAPLDNPHSPGIVETHAREDGLEDLVEQYQDGPFPREHEEPARASIADDEDYGYNSGRRVLRVANE